MIRARGWFDGSSSTKLKNIGFFEGPIDYIDYYDNPDNTMGNKVIAVVYFEASFNGPSTILYVTNWEHVLTKKSELKPTSSPKTKAKPKSVRRTTNKKNNGTSDVTNSIKGAKELH